MLTCGKLKVDQERKNLVRATDLQVTSRMREPEDWLGSCSPLRPCRHGWDGYIRSEAVDTSRRSRPALPSMRLAGDQHHAQPLAVHPPSAATCFAAGGAVPLYPLP